LGLLTARHLVRFLVSRWLVGLAEQLAEMGFHGKAGQHLVAVGVGFDQGSVCEQLFTPDQTGCF
jgi:hypothetical protein